MELRALQRHVFALFVILGLSVGAIRVQAAASTFAQDFASVCNSYAGADAAKCNSCASSQGVWTAIGCIQTSPSEIFSKSMPIFLGIAGGIAFLLILFGGFQILASAGNPDQLNEGRELVSSAVAGLLLIIFSVFLLRLIGYDILRIPGFG